MPREILTYEQCFNYLAGGDLKLLAHHSDNNGHSETIYAVDPLKASQKISLPTQRVCDMCNQPARFLQKTVDHRGLNFIALTCKDHAASGYNVLYAEKLMRD